MMMPRHGDVGIIHRVSNDLVVRTLRSIVVVVRVRCGSGVAGTLREADLLGAWQRTNQQSHEKRNELPTHRPLP